VNDPKSHREVSEDRLEGVGRTNLDSPNPTAAQRDRKRRNTIVVRALGLPTLDSLPVVEDESQVAARTPEEVARRCLAVAISAVKGETGDQELTRPLPEQLDVENDLSPAERRFLENPRPTDQDLADFAWRYECVHVFLWAVGYLDVLKPPYEVCDVAREMALIRDKGADAFLAGATLRPLSEILDRADFYYRLHWATIALQPKGAKSPKVDEEIVAERHRALNWLIRYRNQAWDDITTET
jgi:hypothetical protein